MTFPSEVPSLDDLRVAHDALIDHLDSLTGPAADAGAPSALPGWTRGHLLTHIARNADSFVEVLRAVADGRAGFQYPGGRAQRDGDIEAGARRPWAQIVDDVRHSARALEAALAAQTAWDDSAWQEPGACPVKEVPMRRWREVLVHHVDLADPAYTPNDWPGDYVRRELVLQQMRYDAQQPIGMTGLPQRALELDPVDRLAWLLGRLEVAGLPKPPAF